MHFLSLCASALVLGLASASPVSKEARQERIEPQRVTWYGERPAFSPDGKTMAFISKSYGDVMAYDMETGDVTLITHYPHQGYLRAQYLPNGDLLLLGTEEFEDFALTRAEGIEFYVLPQGSLEPVRLGHKVFEGVAISYENNHISWANDHSQYPEWIAENETIVWEADIVYNSTGHPSLENRREIFREYAPECTPEPQDFRNGDTELIYTCYRITEESRVGDVRGIDIATGEVTIYRNVSDEYNEVEGIYPGGEYATVESAHDQEDPDDNYAIEVWRLKLEPDSDDWVRLTW